MGEYQYMCCDGLSVRQRLADMAEEKYKIFSLGLLPGVEHIMGVRLPKLRALAKEIVRGEWQTYVDWDEKLYFEEKMLHGMILGYAKTDFDRLCVYITQFLPFIDNWSVCDSFCAGLKAFRSHKEQGWEYLKPLASSAKEYEARFALVMYLNFFMEPLYVDEVLQAVCAIKAEGYYARMAAAWLISKCYAAFPEKTWHLLEESPLDPFIHNKAISKICDLRGVSREEKEAIKRLRRVL